MALWDEWDSGWFLVRLAALLLFSFLVWDDDSFEKHCFYPSFGRTKTRLAFWPRKFINRLVALLLFLFSYFRGRVFDTRQGFLVEAELELDLSLLVSIEQQSIEGQ